MPTFVLIYLVALNALNILSAILNQFYSIQSSFFQVIFRFIVFSKSVHFSVISANSYPFLGWHMCTIAVHIVDHTVQCE